MYTYTKKAKMEFSKKLITGALFFIGSLCVVSLLSWFLFDKWPKEIVEHFSWPFVAAIVSYMGKSAYENKPKIETGTNSSEEESNVKRSR